jgi:hypothetical protein
VAKRRKKNEEQRGRNRRPAIYKGGDALVYWSTWAQDHGWRLLLISSGTTPPILRYSFPESGVVVAEVT